MLCVMSLATLFFIITVIQFWGSNYLVSVLKMDEQEVYIAFTVTCITSPTFGVIAGGLITSKFGGYESKPAILICFFLSLGSLISALPTPFINSFYLFIACLWLVLFFGGAVMPNLVGITISSLKQEKRALGGSFTTFFFNLFGYLPAPFLYGLIYDLTKDSNDRLAYTICIYLTIVGVTLIGAATCVKYCKKARREPKVRVSSSDRVSFISNVPIIFNPNFRVQDLAGLTDIEEASSYLEESDSNKKAKLSVQHQIRKDNTISSADDSSNMEIVMERDSKKFEENKDPQV